MSTSPKLWATASREWVIPSRPRPGRKPKSDATPSEKMEDDSPEAKGRRVQNRAAQRAFRERKQSQLAELQARVQSYEKGEIDRNIALQNIAKRMKDENEKLRRENALLEKKVISLEQQIASSRDNERKRFRDVPALSGAAVNGPSRKKSRTNTASSKCDSEAPHYSSIHASPPLSIITSSESNETSTPNFSPISFDLRTQDSPVFPDHSNPIVHIVNHSSDGRAGAFDPTVFSTFNCGLCNDDTTCVCREMAFQQTQADPTVSCRTASLKVDAFALNHTDTAVVGETLPATSTATHGQIPLTEHYSTYQPPIPLRRRPEPGPLNHIFPITAPSPPLSPAICSGDPNNCYACHGDAFGQAFCTAIGQAVSNSTPCGNCPRRSDGNHSLYANHFETRIGSGTFTDYNSDMHPKTKMIPTNDAWRKLQSHPNVSFSDLDLLADVVARRSECPGPQIVLSASAPSGRGDISSPADTQMRSPLVLTSPDPHHSEMNNRSQSPPSDVRWRCGRLGLREVNSEGVAEALQLLDNKFSR